MKRKLFRKPGPGVLEAINLSGLNGVYWFAMSFSAYQAVYLQSHGFSASLMGLLNALGSAVAIASVSFWGTVSDKIGSVKKILVMSLTLGVGLFALIPFLPAERSYSTLLFLIYIPAINFFRGSMTNLTDNILVRNCSELRLNFGVIRSVGSFLYTVGGILIAALVPYVGIPSTFWLSALCMVPAILFALFSRDPKSRAPKRNVKGKGKAEKLNFGALFHNYSYITFLLFAFLFYTACSCEGNFVLFFVKSLGADTEKFSVFSAYRALFEIPFLIFSVKLRRKFPLKYLIMAAAVFMATECLCFSLFAHSFFSIVAFSTFFGLGNGLFLGSALHYVYDLAPDNLKASAQAFFVAMQSTAGILGNLLGGMVFDSVGAKPFYLIVFFLYVLSILIFAGSFLLEKRRGLKIPA